VVVNVTRSEFASPEKSIRFVISSFEEGGEVMSTGSWPFLPYIQGCNFLGWGYKGEAFPSPPGNFFTFFKK
jgi:hypothetical protein